MRRLSPLPAALLLAMAPNGPVAAADEAGADATQLPDVVVTAQKFEQTLDEVAASVSTIDGEQIRRIGAFGFKDLENYTANVSISLAASAGTFAIRGLATPDFNVASDPSVGTVVDGVYYGRSHFLTAFFHDIDRFEVLRGPQGTLFGKNSTAGLFNLTTARAEPERLLRAEVLYGDHGQHSFRPVFQTGIGERLALRLSGNYTNNAGLLYNTALNRRELNQQQATARLRAHYVSDGPWELDLSMFHSRQRQNNDIFQFSTVTDEMLDLARSYDPQVEADPNNFLNSANFAAREDVRITGASATVDFDLGSRWGIDSVRLTSISGWAEAVRLARDIDGDFSPIPFIRVMLTQPSPARQTTEELRLTLQHPSLFGRGQDLTAVLGLYAGRSSLLSFDRFELEDLGAAGAYVLAAQAGQGEGSGGGGGTLAGQLGPALSELADLLDPALSPLLGDEQAALTGLDQHGDELAFFSHAEWTFADGLTAIGGLRIGRERKQAFAFSRAIGPLVPAIADQQDHETRLSRSESDVSPKLGLRWTSSPGINWYATWSRGFKSGGYNAIPLTPNNLEFEPERATGLEFGNKSRLLGGSMRVGFAMFSTHFENLQVSTFRNNRFVILNAAEARSKGFELDLNWHTPLPFMTLYASLGLANARYLRYPDAPAPADAENPTQDLSGRRLPLAPRWTASLIPSFIVPIAQIDSLAVVSVDINYRDTGFLDIDLDPRTKQRTATELNLRFSIRSYRGWEMTLAARNLTDVKKFDQILDQPLAPGNFAAFRTDQGRFVTANLLYSF